MPRAVRGRAAALPYLVGFWIPDAGWAGGEDEEEESEKTESLAA